MVCKVGAGSSADYVIHAQAKYHLEGIEPEGRWYATEETFAELVDGAPIDNAAFRNLHDGMTPDGQTQLGKPNAKGERVCGYDIQFGAPKSVSILWALADPATRAKIEVIQERAVRAALDFAQSAGAQVRTGHNGVEIQKCRMFGATFQHGESRPTEREDGHFRSDMQLHTHTIVMNIAQGEDGEWHALDGRPLLGLQRAMGAQYHAELSRLLETELGCRTQRHDLIEERHNGEFEVAGIPPELVEKYSTRSNQIIKAMADLGLKTRDQAALAADIALATRKGKSSESRESQLERWAAEVEAAGYTWKQLAAQTLGQEIDQATEQERAQAYEQSLLEIGDRLTETESVFSQADLYAAIAAAGAGRGYGAVDVQAIEAQLLADARIVELAKDSTGFAIYSTPDLRLIEHEMRDWAHEQAIAYPTTQESGHDQYSSIPAIDATFGAEGRTREFDSFAIAGGSAAESIHELPGLSCIPLASDLGRAEMLLPDTARNQLDVGAAERPADYVRRSGARGLAPHTIDPAAIDKYLADRAAAGEALTAEQGGALHHIGSHGGSHALAEGGAGTGKTKALMQGSADLYHGIDYKVYATAQRWLTTLELAKIKTPDGKHIEGRAAAKWIADYRAGKVKWDSRTLLLVDEAGQMGSREAHGLMQIARDTGCRIVWTGDARQQKAVAAGDALSILAKELGSYRLEESQRMQPTAADVLAWRDFLSDAEAHRRAMTLSDEQRAALVERYGEAVHRAGAVWARKAATDFSYGRAAEALQAYQDHGLLIWTDTHGEALSAAVDGWSEFKLANPDRTACVSAARHVDIRALNDSMRDFLRANDQIGDDLATVSAVATNGDKVDLAIAVGDQVRVGTAIKDLQIYNGMIGIVRDVHPGSRAGHPLLTLDMTTPSGVRQIQIETQRLADENGRAQLAHAYAATNTQIQGDTVEKTFGQVSAMDRANSIYVIASRAREATELFISRESIDIALKQSLPLSERPAAKFTEAQRLNYLAKTLSRAQVKRTTLDYEESGQAAADPAATVRDATADLAEERISAEQERTMGADSSSTTVNQYLRSRGLAGDLWSQIHREGGRQQHPAWSRFEDAQAARDAAASDIARDAALLKALDARQVVSREEFAADHLMATGTRSRSEAADQAEAHAEALWAQAEQQPEQEPAEAARQSSKMTVQQVLTSAAVAGLDAETRADAETVFEEVSKELGDQPVEYEDIHDAAFQAAQTPQEMLAVREVLRAARDAQPVQERAQADQAFTIKGKNAEQLTALAAVAAKGAAYSGEFLAVMASDDIPRAQKEADWAKARFAETVREALTAGATPAAIMDVAEKIDVANNNGAASAAAREFVAAAGGDDRPAETRAERAARLKADVKVAARDLGMAVENGDGAKISAAAATRDRASDRVAKEAKAQTAEDSGRKARETADRVRGRGFGKEQGRPETEAHAPGHFTPPTMTAIARHWQDRAGQPGSKIDSVAQRHGHVEVKMKNGATVKDTGSRITADRMSPATARDIISAAQSHGWKNVTVNGTPSSKEMLAEAAFAAGLGVANPEMQEFVEYLRAQAAEQAQQKPQQEAAGVAKDRAQQAKAESVKVDQATARAEKTRAASSPALRMIEAGRLTRDLAIATGPVERFAIADRLAELTNGEAAGGKFVVAQQAREQAAAAIMQDPAMMQQAQGAGVLDRVADVHHEATEAAADSQAAQAATSNSSQYAEQEAE